MCFCNNFLNYSIHKEQWTVVFIYHDIYFKKQHKKQHTHILRFIKYKKIEVGASSE